MWIVRVLSGPQKNQVFPLKPGVNIIGRGPSCQVILSSQRVSKQHAKVTVTGDKLLLEDLNSRNGSMVNGVKVQQKLLNLGDQVSIDEFVLEVAQLDEAQLLQRLQAASPSVSVSAPEPAHAYTADINASSHHAPPAEPQPAATTSTTSADGLVQRLLAYIEEVVLPGVYRLGSLYDFRLVLGAFVLGFVVLATIFSVVPMNQVTTENIQNESKRRALTIAKNLALMNHQAVLQKLNMSLTTRLSDLEPGVESSLIVSAENGMILAPAQRAGSFADEPFVHRIRQESQERVEMLSDTKIAASVPISAFDSELGIQTVRAHAVIFYNMEKSAIDGKRAFSLYVQSTFIALFLGVGLYFLLFRLIQHPVKVLNKQMDEVLARNRHDLTLDFKNRELLKLTTQINNLLARSVFDQNPESQSPSVWVSKDQEARKIVDLTGWASCAFDPVTSQFIASNDSFLELGFSNGPIAGQGVENLLDPALKESLKDLLAQLSQPDHQQVSHQLPLQTGESVEIRAHKIHLGGQDQDFVVLVFIPAADDYSNEVA